MTKALEEFFKMRDILISEGYNLPANYQCYITLENELRRLEELEKRYYNQKQLLNAQYGKLTYYDTDMKGGLHIVLSPRNYGIVYETNRRSAKIKLIDAYNVAKDSKTFVNVKLTLNEIIVLLKEVR